ncbi:hypothetical protein NDU88_009030 [Pleurodeles waltl]|uniref:Uncharacterized protein n=1 Tax=Pleurodeles waltl TaxID=8319 RepID=A0AAV7NZQ1_PLEWA|nr:hypothetical protein NDU88_009030 [Pleurodeles waltl]
MPPRKPHPRSGRFRGVRRGGGGYPKIAKGGTHPLMHHQKEAQKKKPSEVARSMVLVSMTTPVWCWSNRVVPWFAAASLPLGACPSAPYCGDGGTTMRQTSEGGAGTVNKGGEKVTTEDH